LFAAAAVAAGALVAGELVAAAPLPAVDPVDADTAACDVEARDDDEPESLPQAPKTKPATASITKPPIRSRRPHMAFRMPFPLSETLFNALK